MPKSDVQLSGHYATPERSFKSYTRTHWYFNGGSSATFEWQDIVREGGASSRPHVVASDPAKAGSGMSKAINFTTRLTEFGKLLPSNISTFQKLLSEAKPING